MADTPGREKGIPSVMTPDTLSGWTTATWNAGIAPKSFPTRNAWPNNHSMDNNHLCFQDKLW